MRTTQHPQNAGLPTASCTQEVGVRLQWPIRDFFCVCDALKTPEFSPKRSSNFVDEFVGLPRLGRSSHIRLEMAASSSCKTTVLKIYQDVMEDVIRGVRDIFAEDGVDEQVLQELKQTWETKLMASKAVETQEEMEKKMGAHAAVENGSGAGSFKQQQVQQQQQQQQQHHQQQQQVSTSYSMQSSIKNGLSESMV